MTCEEYVISFVIIGSELGLKPVLSLHRRGEPAQIRNQKVRRMGG
jgi:hypothetical protein